MQKVNSKILGIAILLISLLLTSSIAIEQTIAPGGAVGDDLNPGGPGG